MFSYIDTKKTNELTVSVCFESTQTTKATPLLYGGDTKVPIVPEEISPIIMNTEHSTFSKNVAKLDSDPFAGL